MANYTPVPPFLPAPVLLGPPAYQVFYFVRVTGIDHSVFLFYRNFHHPAPAYFDAHSPPRLFGFT